MVECSYGAGKKENYEGMWNRLLINLHFIVDCGGGGKPYCLRVGV